MGGDDLGSDDDYLVPSMVNDTSEGKRERDQISESPSKRSITDRDDVTEVETKRRKKKNKTLSKIDFPTL